MQGPMYQRAVDAGKFNPNAPGRVALCRVLDLIPPENRNIAEPELRKLMHEAARTGRKTIHFTDDGKRASVVTKVTARFPPHYRDALSMQKIEDVEREIRNIGLHNMRSYCLTLGHNSDGHTMNFEVFAPWTEADLLLTGGICFFPMPKGEVPDGFLVILPNSKEQTVNISMSDCAAIVEGTDYPGNAGKKTAMTEAGWVAAQNGTIMEHFGLGVFVIRDPATGRFISLNVKIGGASFTGKTTTLAGDVDDRVVRPGESRITLNDDMIFTDPATGRAYGLEQGQFFTCFGLSNKERFLWEAQKDSRVIGYNIVITDGQFDFSNPKTDPNARIAVPRGVHCAIDVDRINTTDTPASSGRLAASVQLVRGPHFPPAYIVKDPLRAAVLLAVGPTQKTAAQVGGSRALNVPGFSEFKPILDEAAFQTAKKEGRLTPLQAMFPPERVDKLLTKPDNFPVPAAQLIQDLFVSGFIMENPKDYMEKLLALHHNFPDMLHIGLNTGSVGPIVANAIMHPFDGPTIRIYNNSVQLPPVYSQDLLFHALRGGGEIVTEFDSLLGVDVIVKAGSIDFTSILPRTLYAKAGIDYERTVRSTFSKYADFLERNGLGRYAEILRN